MRIFTFDIKKRQEPVENRFFDIYGKLQGKKLRHDLLVAFEIVKNIKASYSCSLYSFEYVIFIN